MAVKTLAGGHGRLLFSAGDHKEEEEQKKNKNKVGVVEDKKSFLLSHFFEEIRKGRGKKVQALTGVYLSRLEVEVRVKAVAAAGSKWSRFRDGTEMTRGGGGRIRGYPPGWGCAVFYKYEPSY